MNTPRHYSLQFGQTLIEYSLRFSERKHLAIHVHPDLRVEVDAPLDSELAQIEQKLHKRAAWIVKQQRELARYAYDLPPREYVSGETYRYLGRQYRLKVHQIEEKPEQVRLDRGMLNVYIADRSQREHVRELLQSWFRSHAQRVYAERLQLWLPAFQRQQLPQPQLVVRRMKSRWGSCTAAGKITLNLKLIHTPKPCIDYIIVHELCHLVHPNHSPAFYKLLQRVMPNWEKRKEQLNLFEF